jgi:hypothetical protein
VFRTVAERLGDDLTRIPDGETGERTNWVQWQFVRVLAKHPALEPTGVTPDAYHKVGALRIKAGATTHDLAFGPLGYAEVAKSSYAVFRRLRDAGVIGAGMRFQVALPTPIAPIGGFLAPEDQARVEGPYEQAMLAEVAAIAAAIPHHDLAIQWDCAREFMFIEELLPRPADDLWGWLGDRVARQGAAVPSDVEFGFHLCYGDRGHRHFVEPENTGKLVAMANLIAQRVQRSIEFLHLPVPRDRDDDAYFAPLKQLQLHPETRLFLGLVHFTDGLDGVRRRMTAASRFVSNYGVSTECGLGRRPAKTIVPLLDLLAAASRL